jgi:hypothetical protein
MLFLSICTCFRFYNLLLEILKQVQNDKVVKKIDQLVDFFYMIAALNPASCKDAHWGFNFGNSPVFTVHCPL